MKTYITNQYTQRLADYLVAYSYPFHFDGESIEFTASENFVKNMQSYDKVLAKIEFVIIII